MTLTLGGINDSDVQKVGLRAVDLAAAYKLKVPVPLCFVIPNIVFEEFLLQNRLVVEVNRILEEAGMGELSGDEASGLRAYYEIRALFENASIPEEFKESLMESYEALGSGSGLDAQGLLEENIPVVNLVASPSYEQDPERLSGVLLNVQGFGNLLNAVKSCWLSVFLPEQVKFRKAKGITDFGVGVIVQNFVQPDVTADVRTKGALGSYELPMHAYFGLPDITYSISRDFYSISRESFGLATENVVAQEFVLLRNRKSGTLIKRNLGSRGFAQKLQYRQIMEAARAAERVSSRAGFHCRALMLVRGQENFLFLLDRLEEREREKTSGESAASVLPEKKEVKAETLSEIIASAGGEKDAALEGEGGGSGEETQKKTQGEAREDLREEVKEKPPGEVQAVKLPDREAEERIPEFRDSPGKVSPFIWRKEEKSGEKKPQPRMIILEKDDDFILSKKKEGRAEEEKKNSAEPPVPPPGASTPVHAPGDGGSPVPAGERPFDPHRDFYMGIILDIEPAVDQGIMDRCQQEFGSIPENVGAAMEKLIEADKLPEKEQILKLKEMKKLLEEGESINLDVFLEITEKLRGTL